MNDEARDAHLRQALRHAPDRDAAPPPALSASILAQARAAVQPAAPRREVAPPWWSRLWQQVATPAFGGAFASVMLAGVIGVMWQDGPPPEALPGAERDLAKAPTASAPAAVPATPAIAPPAPAAAMQDNARADEPKQAPPQPATPPQKAAPAAPPAAARGPVPKAAETSREVAPAPPEAENATAPSGAVEARKQRAAAGSLTSTVPEPAAAAVPAPAAPPAVAPAPPPAPAPVVAAAPAAPPPAAAPAPPPAPAVAPARSILPETTRDAARDAEVAPRTARREASAPGALGAASLARMAPPLDPLAAPLAALVGAAPDDLRSRNARQALLDARRQTIGPWQPVETPTVEPTLVVAAPDGGPLGRLWIDELAVTWQPARAQALRALKAPPPR